MKVSRQGRLRARLLLARQMGLDTMAAAANPDGVWGQPGKVPCKPKSASARYFVRMTPPRENPTATRGALGKRLRRHINIQIGASKLGGGFIQSVLQMCRDVAV